MKPKIKSGDFILHINGKWKNGKYGFAGGVNKITFYLICKTSQTSSGILIDKAICIEYDHAKKKWRTALEDTETKTIASELAWVSYTASNILPGVMTKTASVKSRIMWMQAPHNK